MGIFEITYWQACDSDATYRIQHCLDVLINVYLKILNVIIFLGVQGI